jgi:hypothetical protein
MQNTNLSTSLLITHLAPEERVRLGYFEVNNLLTLKAAKDKDKEKTHIGRDKLADFFEKIYSFEYLPLITHLIIEKLACFLINCKHGLIKLLNVSLISLIIDMGHIQALWELVPRVKGSRLDI